MQSKLFTGVCSVHRCSSHAADISYYYFGMPLVFLMAKVKQSSIESFSGKKSTVLLYQRLTSGDEDKGGMDTTPHF